MAYKPKPKVPTTGARDSAKYTNFRAKDKGGRSSGLVGNKPEGQYSMGVGPRVGGTVKPTGRASGTANKGLIKKALGNIKKTAASPQAKRAARRAYGR